MTRHELTPNQIGTSPSRPADNLALVDGGIGITHSLGHICPGKDQLKGLYIAPRGPEMASPPQPAVSTTTGQIQKNP